MSGCRSESAIADWGKNYGSKWLRKLGFKRDRGPSQPTLHRIFKGINHLLLESVLSNWAQAVLSLWPSISAQQLEGISMDGKTLRGSLKQGAADTHLLSCISQTLGIVISQVAVEDKTNEMTKSAFGIFRVPLKITHHAGTCHFYYGLILWADDKI